MSVESSDPYDIQRSGDGAGNLKPDRFAELGGYAARGLATGGPGDESSWS